MVRYFGFGEFSGERFLVHRGLVFGIARETLEFPMNLMGFIMKLSYEMSEVMRK